MNVFLYILIVLIWGTTWLPIKMQLGVVPAEISVFYRFSMAAIILLFWTIAQNKAYVLHKRHHLYIIALGVLLFSFNYVLFYMGSHYLASGLLSVIFSMILVFNIFHSALFFRKKIERVVICAAFLGILGMILTFWDNVSEAHKNTFYLNGILLCLAGTFVASLGNMISTKLQKEGLPVMVVNAYGMSYGAVILGIFCVLKGSDFVFEWSTSYIFSLLYLSIFGSIIAFGCYLKLLGNIGPERAAYSAVMFPIVALLISTIFEDFIWTELRMLGILFILLGNILALLGRSKIYKMKTKTKS